MERYSILKTSQHWSRGTFLNAPILILLFFYVLILISLAFVWVSQFSQIWSHIPKPCLRSFRELRSVMLYRLPYRLSVIHTYIRLLTTSPKGLFSANYKGKDKNKNVYKLNYLKLQLQIIRISFLPLKFV